MGPNVRAPLAVVAVLLVAVLVGLLVRNRPVTPPPREWPTLTSGPAIPSQIVVDGERFEYTDSMVSPPYRLTGYPVIPDASELTRPELPLVRMAHAVTLPQPDWEMWSALWDPQSRAVTETDMQKYQVTRAERVEGWQKAYGGKELEVFRRLEIPGYVLLYVGAVGDPPEARAKVLPMVLKKDKAGRWWLTHDLQENPVAAVDFYRDR